MGLWLAAEQSTLDCVQARISLMEDEEYQRLHRATAFPGVLEFPDSGIPRVFSLGSEAWDSQSSFRAEDSCRVSRLPASKLQAIVQRQE